MEQAALQIVTRSLLAKLAECAGFFVVKIGCYARLLKPHLRSLVLLVE